MDTLYMPLLVLPPLPSPSQKTHYYVVHKRGMKLGGASRQTRAIAITRYTVYRLLYVRFRLWVAGTSRSGRVWGLAVSLNPTVVVVYINSNLKGSIWRTPDFTQAYTHARTCPFDQM